MGFPSRIVIGFCLLQIVDSCGVLFLFGESRDKYPETFQICVSKAKDWEKKLDNLSRLWRALHQKQHAVEGWLDQAQAVLEDNEDDFESIIRKHKGFFVRVDDRMLQEYLRACQDILVVLEEEDRPALTESMENIQQRWEVRPAVCLCSPDEHLTYLMPVPLLNPVHISVSVPSVLLLHFFHGMSFHLEQSISFGFFIYC